MARLKVSPSGQVYDVDLPSARVTRDEGGGYYLHGQGHFVHYTDLEEALAKKRELEVYGTYGGRKE